MNDKERMLRAYKEIDEAKYYKSHLQRFMPDDVVYNRTTGEKYTVMNIEPIFRFDLIFNTYLWFHYVETDTAEFIEIADGRLTTEKPKEETPFND